LPRRLAKKEMEILIILKLERACINIEQFITIRNPSVVIGDGIGFVIDNKLLVYTYLSYLNSKTDLAPTY
jgi:hypothetical protein